MGAHIGWYGLSIASRFPNRQVHCFEPIPPTYEVLVRNVSLNRLSNVTLHRSSLGAVARQERFFYSAPHSVLASTVDILPEGEPFEGVEATTVRIDDIRTDWLPQPVAFIKCDVEGAEYAVLQGARRTLESDRPVLLLELYEPWCRRFGYSADEVFCYLASLGYAAFAVQPNNQLRQISSIPTLQRATHSTDYNIFFLHLEKHKTLLTRLVAK